MKRTLISVLIGLTYGTTIAAPLNTVHNKQLNFTQVEFLNLNLGRNGTVVYGSVTTPMNVNGVTTQDVGAMKFSTDAMTSSTGVFPGYRNVVPSMDVNGLEVTLREYSIAMDSIKKLCSNGTLANFPDAELTNYLRTLQAKPGGNCDEKNKAFNYVLSQNKTAPRVKWACIANCNGEYRYSYYNRTAYVPPPSTHDGCCFVGDTQILMSDGRTKDIRHILPGDWVMVLDFESGHLVPSEVLSVLIKNPKKLYTINNALTLTPDHPLLRDDYTWASLDPELSKINYGDDIQLLNIHDRVQTQHDVKSIDNIEKVEQLELVYTFTVDHHDHNYIANTYIVHNRNCN